MNVRLSHELQRFVDEAVRSGRYAREDDVIRDALTRLKASVSADPAHSVPRVKRPKVSHAAQPAKPMTNDEFHRHLIALGLMTQLPDSAADFDDPDDEPIPIEGELLSETVIRERR